VNGAFRETRETSSGTQPGGTVVWRRVNKTERTVEGSAGKLQKYSVNEGLQKTVVVK